MRLSHGSLPRVHVSIVMVGALVTVATSMAMPAVAGAAGADSTTKPYSVVLKDTATPTDVAARSGTVPRTVYRNALNGYSASLTTGQLAALRTSGDVIGLVPDSTYRLV